MQSERGLARQQGAEALNQMEARGAPCSLRVAAMVSWESRTALSCERDRFVGGLPPLQWSYTFGWRSPAFTMVASFDGARIVGGLPPLQWSPRFVGGLPPLQWSPVLLSASRLYNAPPFSWRPLANIQWSSALLALASLAAFRLYNGLPFCWRPPAFTMVPRFVTSVTLSIVLPYSHYLILSIIHVNITHLIICV